jgi:hypothetical protein
LLAIHLDRQPLNRLQGRVDRVLAGFGLAQVRLQPVKEFFHGWVGCGLLFVVHAAVLSF